MLHTPMPSFVRNPGGLRDHPALVLNADYRPLSYLPLSLWPWQEAVKAAVLGTRGGGGGVRRRGALAVRRSSEYPRWSC